MRPNVKKALLISVVLALVALITFAFYISSQESAPSSSVATDTSKVSPISSGKDTATTTASAKPNSSGASKINGFIVQTNAFEPCGLEDKFVCGSFKLTFPSEDDAVIFCSIEKDQTEAFIDKLKKATSLSNFQKSESGEQLVNFNYMTYSFKDHEFKEVEHKGYVNWVNDLYPFRQKESIYLVLGESNLKFKMELDFDPKAFITSEMSKKSNYEIFMDEERDIKLKFLGEIDSDSKDLVGFELIVARKGKTPKFINLRETIHRGMYVKYQYLSDKENDEEDDDGEKEDYEEDDEDDKEKEDYEEDDKENDKEKEDYGEDDEEDDKDDDDFSYTISHIIDYIINEKLDSIPNFVSFYLLVVAPAAKKSEIVEFYKKFVLQRDICMNYQIFLFGEKRTQFGAGVADINLRNGKKRIYYSFRFKDMDKFDRLVESYANGFGSLDDKTFLDLFPGSVNLHTKGEEFMISDLKQIEFTQKALKLIKLYGFWPYINALSGDDIEIWNNGFHIVVPVTSDTPDIEEDTLTVSKLVKQLFTVKTENDDVVKRTISKSYKMESAGQLYSAKLTVFDNYKKTNLSAVLIQIADQNISDDFHQKPRKDVYKRNLVGYEYAHNDRNIFEILQNIENNGIDAEVEYQFNNLRDSNLINNTLPPFNALIVGKPEFINDFADKIKIEGAEWELEQPKN